MKKNNKNKLFITLSSGLLLSLATNQNVIFASESKETEIENNVEVIENSIIIEELNAYTINAEEDKEVKNLIEQLKVTKVDEKTYKVLGNTIANSEIVLVVDQTNEYISQTDEDGNFETVITDFTKDSSMQVFIKDSSETTYIVNLSFADYMQQFEKNSDNTKLENSNKETETAPEVEESEEVPAEEETAPEVEESEEVPAEEETALEVEESEEVPAEEETALEVEESEEVPAEEEIAPEVEESEEVPAEEETAPEVEESEEMPAEEEATTKDVVQASGTPKAQIATISLFSVSSSRVANDGVYTVKSGDFLSNIASSFNISLSQLLAWNPQITNPNSIQVGQKINVTKAAYDKFMNDKEDYNQAQPRPFSTNQEFINFIAPYAMDIANMYGEEQLYASVMIAQAAHESAFGQSLLSLPPYFNLFGIKGSYNGQSVPMGTWEDTEGGIVNITAKFRDYPSYYESMLDYAHLLRNGLIGSPNFYSKTWVRNTNSYKDATAYLTGTYATDKQYNVKVNNIIEQYNLTQFDTHIVDTSINNTVSVSYDALISLSGFTIDTKPWGTSGFQMVDKTNTYLGAHVQVTQETTDGNYALISYDGNVLGWVDKKALEISSEIQDVSSSVNVNYKGQISKSGYSIDTLPWGTSGYKTLMKSNSFVGQEVDVIKETSNGKYSLISLNGKVLGWIDSKAIANYNIQTDISSSHDTSYNAIVETTGFSIDTKPWGTDGYHTLSHTNDYLGRTVEVVKETNNNNYVLISHDGKLLGWVDKKALRTAEVVTNVASSEPVYYNATIGQASYSIDTMPWGTKGYQTISKTNNYIGQEVKVIREANNGNYALISLNGNPLGWVDKKALQTYAVDTNVSSAKAVSYNGIISASSYSIDSKPWGTTGYQTIAKTTDYIGTPVKVTKEKGAYVLIEANGNPLGWVDKKALQTYTVDTSISGAKNVSYNATISAASYSIDTKPWGTSGYQTVAKTTNYIGTPVKVTKEKGAYALISVDGVTLGWVDKKALN